MIKKNILQNKARKYEDKRLRAQHNVKMAKAEMDRSSYRAFGDWMKATEDRTK